ncbi:facilitated trehalose transporter Tret1-like isoform X3 [Homarus americanus]|uniref:facilitated trehalose transporter Tret1-like isoform X3 n=1 Tax=Homarus americanus TaxID=6706 RepID=UPI001C464B22|nr:facilitated trehalose transporter Tret1-like isoform X3 [Homarus americanus]
MVARTGMEENITEKEVQIHPEAANRNPTYGTQYYGTVAATMGGLAMGTLLGYSSPAGPHLMASTNNRSRVLSNSTGQPLQLSQAEYNWFSSSVTLGAAAGALMGGLCINSIGRRGTMLIFFVPYLTGWALVAAGGSFGMMVVGRVMSGVCMGITCVAVPTYIGEIASAEIRGVLGSGFQLMVTLGILMAYVTGAVVTSWTWLAAVCTLPTVVHAIMLCFTKESPTFFVSKGNTEEAVSSLQYFRGRHYDIMPELNIISKSLEEAKLNNASIWDLLKPYNLKPLLICLSILSFAQFSGITPVLFNLSTVFKDSGSKMSENASAIIVAGVQVLATLVGALLMDKAGRRFLLAISSGFMCVSVGELFSPEVKEASASIVTVVNWLTSFTITLTFLPLQTALGDYSAFWLFGGVCLLAFFFTLLLVPETKGKTLQEITAQFGNRSSID